MAPAGALRARQAGDDGFYYDDDYVPFWYTHTGIIVKWSLFLGLVVLFAVYLFVGHWHAKKRMRQGLPPLAYHRWLVPRSQLARVDPRYAYAQPAGYSTYRPQQPQNDAYGMYAVPPPVYDPSAPRPPGYDQPPQYGGPQHDAGTKVDPNQHREGPSTGIAEESYAPPAGPPPSAMRPQETGGSNNPYRV